MEIMLSHFGIGMAYDALDGLNIHAQRLHLRHIGVAAAMRSEQADIARFFQRFAEHIPEMGGVAGQAGLGAFPDELVGSIPQFDGTRADIQRHRNIPDTVFGFRTADADRTFYDLYCLPDVNDRAIFFNKLRLQSQKFLHSHSSAEQKPDAQAHAVIGQHLHQVCDFRCGKGFLALCGSGCPHLFSKPDRVAAHKVIGFCLLKDLVEHPSCLADVRIRAAITPHPFQEVFNVDGAYMDTNYIIETKNLTKQYGSQKSVADLNIHVKRGRIYGLLGRNGAGKTTTMKMLLGLTKPTSGEVKIWGKSLQGNEKKLLPRIGSLIESPGFYPNLTATENLRIFATLRGVPNSHAIKDALDLVGLPYKDKKLFSQYSLGMKQRLAIALAVMHDPELLILDEPINGLDPIGIAEVRSFIRELCDARGKTILISSHILSEISLLADDIGIIDHGALLEEESLAELEQKSSKHIRFTLSDTAQAARILERNFHENHFSIQDDHNLRLHNLDLPVGKIVTAFVENGLEVSEAHTCEESLEDYFKRVTGGEGIA